MIVSNLTGLKGTNSGQIRRTSSAPEAQLKAELPPEQPNIEARELEPVLPAGSHPESNEEEFIQALSELEEPGVPEFESLLGLSNMHAMLYYRKPRGT